jgi:cob(I)alamin adenosyltransferase
MRIYTRNGDDGTTGLYGGSRVAKDSLRVEAIGTVDETNSAIGLAAAACTFEELTRVMARLQPLLFDIGASLSTPMASAKAAKVPQVTAGHVEEMERMIDATWGPLPEMRSFVLPGGTELAARLHGARCVARRAERLVVALARVEEVQPLIVPWLNRLSDLLFAMARRANQLAGVADVPWTPGV